MQHRTLRHISLLAAVLAASGLTACASGGSGNGATTKDGVTTMKLWTHNGGNDAELAINQQVADDFNASQDTYKVELESFPQDAYNDAVTAAAAAKQLPCIMDIDGPNVPNWAWAGYLEPIEEMRDHVADQLPSTLGVVDDQLYSFGNYDVALNLITRKSILDEYGIRVPTIDEPWTGEEFDAALATIKAGGTFAYPLDLGTASGGEWIPYAYGPILQSFGGDLIDRDGYTTAEGALNGPEALAWANWSQDLIDNGYIAQKSGADSTIDFTNGKTAIVWSGSWAAVPVTEKFDDVLFLPPVDFGHGPKIGGASWQWGVTSGCSDTGAAMDYLAYSLKPENIAAVAKATGAIPASEEAAAQIPSFTEGGANRIFMDFSREYAVMRPETPAYPFIATEFGKATQDILNGADPQATLDSAVKAIDANIKSNGGYNN